MKHIIISFISQDKPGIVDQLSTVVKNHHGNWQTSSLHRLSGLFAGIVEITASEENYENLISALQGLSQFNLQIQVAQSNEKSTLEKVVLELTANDRAGIVNQISSVIHQHQGNLIKLVSKQSSAPHSGQLMFNAKVHVEITAQNIDNMIEALENIADDLMVDITR